MNINELVLKSGSHSSPEYGLCFMEAVALFNGEKHSDHPGCACLVLTSYMIRLNDSMNDEERQLLKPFVTKIVGTRDGKSSKRLEILVKNAVCKVTPHVLKLTKNEELIKHAKILEDLASNFNYAAGAAADAAADAARYAAGAGYVESRKVYWDMCINAIEECLKV